MVESGLSLLLSSIVACDPQTRHRNLLISKSKLPIPLIFGKDHKGPPNSDMLVVLHRQGISREQSFAVSTQASLSSRRIPKAQCRNSANKKTRIAALCGKAVSMTRCQHDAVHPGLLSTPLRSDSQIFGSLNVKSTGIRRLSSRIYH